MSKIIELSDLLNFASVQSGVNFNTEIYENLFEDDSLFEDESKEEFDEKAAPLNRLILDFANIIPGDIIHHGSEYRNDGKLIWNGTSVEKLSYDLDEYGHLPHNYTLNEFHDYDYFQDTISHNNIRWIKINSSINIVGIYEVRYNNYENRINHIESRTTVGRYGILTMGKYFVVEIIDKDGEKYNYKILIPHNYLNVNTPRELYKKLISDKDLDMKNNNNSLPLEIDECLTGLTDIEDMYVIYGGNYDVK